VPTLIHLPGEITQMIKGRVKWFDERKGYGFIKVEGGQEYFVHQSDIVGFRDTDPWITGGVFRALYPGETVEFDISQDAKGEKAVDVRIC
jgi:CspA family cold shock protein